MSDYCEVAMLSGRCAAWRRHWEACSWQVLALSYRGTRDLSGNRIEPCLPDEYQALSDLSQCDEGQKKHSSVLCLYF